MKLIKLTLLFIALVAIQIATAEWLNVPPPAEARGLMMVGGGVPAGDACSTQSVAIDQQTGATKYESAIGFGQSFTPASTFQLYSIIVYLDGGSSGTATARVGTSLTSGYTEVTGITIAEGGLEIIFPTKPTLSASTTYVFYLLNDGYGLHYFYSATDVYGTADVDELYYGDTYADAAIYGGRDIKFRIKKCD